MSGCIRPTLLPKKRINRQVSRLSVDPLHQPLTGFIKTVVLNQSGCEIGLIAAIPRIVETRLIKMVFASVVLLHLVIKHSEIIVDKCRVWCGCQKFPITLLCVIELTLPSQDSGERDL